MRRITPLLSLAAMLVFHPVIGQTDSSRHFSRPIDAGQLYLDRTFTQGIRVSGTDLERMPFTNLADALSAWTYGVYMVPSNIIYVVDGNPLADANAYSVYDIESVTLVQNASVEINTGAGQGIVALVETRHHHREGLGLQVAAKTGLAGGPSRQWGLYDQFYAGLSRQLWRGLEAGVSVDHQHDLWPSEKGAGIRNETPSNLDRWRFNGWMNWKIDPHHTISLSANYTTQRADSDRVYPYAPDGTVSDYQITSSAHEKQNLFTPSLVWKGRWGGLANHFQAGYVAGLHTTDANYDKFNVDMLTDVNDSVLAMQQHTDHVFVRDRISYRLRAGKWFFEPAVNGSYEHIIQHYRIDRVAGWGGTPTYASSSWEAQRSHIWLLTPSLDIHYKEVFDLQGGVVANVTGRPAGTVVANSRRVFPFASVGIDVLRLAEVKGSSSLKLFGSYAQRSLWSANDYALNDLGHTNDGLDGMHRVSVMGYSYNYVFITGAGITTPAVPTLWVWHAGASWTGLQDRVRFNYSFERRNQTTMIVQTTSSGGYSYAIENWRLGMHSAGVDVTVFDRDVLRWRTGLHAAVWGNKTQPANYYVKYPAIGDHYTESAITSVTGGWTNRVEIGAISLGLDLVYHIRETVAGSELGTYVPVNYFSVSNLYAGYRLHLKQAGEVELYVNARGVPQNDKGSVVDRRRFVGLGGRWRI